MQANPTAEYFQTQPRQVRPHCDREPSCARLLDDPVALFLGKRPTWPDHLCESVMRASTLSASGFLSGYSGYWQELWPLPLGASAIGQEVAWVRRFRRDTALGWGIDQSHAAPVHPAVNASRAWALFAIATPTDWGFLDAFGTATFPEEMGWTETSVPTFGVDPPDPTIAVGDRDSRSLRVRLRALGEGGPRWTVGALFIRWQGYVDGLRPRSETLRLAENLRRWWASFIGGQVGPGRRLGSGTFDSQEQLLLVIRFAIEQLEATERAVTELGVERVIRASGLVHTQRRRGLDLPPQPPVESPRQLRRWCRDVGLSSWADAEAAARRLPV